MTDLQDHTTTPSTGNETDTAAAPPTVGVITLPDGAGTPVGRFFFVCNRDDGTTVEIGTPVAADTGEGTVIGTVIDMRTVGRDRNPQSADLRDGFPAPPAASAEDVIVAEAQIFHQNRIRSVRPGTVRAATATEVGLAAGADSIDRPVPAGTIRLGDGTTTKVCVDADNLLGPDAAHMIVGGRSGAAAKTSFMGVMLRSVLHHRNVAVDDDDDPETATTAAIVFNVKGEDLIWIDQPPVAEDKYQLSDADLDGWAAMNVPATPFPDVDVYGVGRGDLGGDATHSARPDALPLSWSMTDVWPYLHYVFPWIRTPDGEKVDAWMQDFRDRVMYASGANKVDTFAKLTSWFQSVLNDGWNEDGEMKETGWGSHHPATLRKIRRMFDNLPGRTKGLLSNGAGAGDVPDEGWRPGQVVVVDIAGLDPLVQGLAIARTLDRLLKAAESGTLGVDNLICVTDELNAFAPAQGGEMDSVRKILRKIATQGRYAGLSLWGAAQALSKIDELIVDNAATRALGVTSDRELSTPTYGKMPRGISERIATLPRGEVALWHATFREALIVSFPRPAWQTGKAKGRKRRSRATDLLGLSEASAAAAVEGIATDHVAEIVHGAVDQADALAKIDKARVPDMDKQVVRAAIHVDPDDPFDLG